MATRRKQPAKKRRPTTRLAPPKLALPAPKLALPASPRPKPTSPLPTPTIPIPPTKPTVLDAAERARVDRLLLDAKKLAAEASRTSYRLGLLLRDLATDKNLALLGYDSFSELLEHEDFIGRSTAYRLVRLVDAFDQRLAEQLGSEKADLLLRYVSAAHPRETPVDVLRRDPLLQLGLDARRRLSNASTRDLEAALRHLRAQTTAPPAYVDRVKRASHRIGIRLEKRAIHTAKVRSVEHGSRLVVRIEVDGSEAEKLLALLSR